MVDLRKVWEDVRENCRSNEYCETCKYRDFNSEVCSIRRITRKEIGWIEDMFIVDGEIHEY